MDYVRKFISYLEYERRYSLHTIKAYEKDITSFFSFWEDEGKAFAAITHRDMRYYVASLSESHISATSINRKLSALRSFYKFLQREGFYDHNPLNLMKAMKTAKRLPVVVPEEKLAQLLDQEAFFAAGFEGQRDKLII